MRRRLVNTALTLWFIAPLFFGLAVAGMVAAYSLDINVWIGAVTSVGTWTASTLVICLGAEEADPDA